MAAIPLFGHTKVLHTLIGMGISADLAAVAISHKGLIRDIFKKKKKKKDTKALATGPRQIS